MPVLDFVRSSCIQVRHFFQLPLAVVLFCSLLSAQTVNASYFSGASQIVVLGDSASSVTYNGADYRFTNDLVWGEYLANSLGLNSAIYAQPGGFTADAPSHLSLFRQMDNYYGDNGGAADANAVHMLFIGGNDPGILGLSLQQSHLNRQAALQDLIANGASKIVLFNMPSPYRYSDADIALYVPEGVIIYDMDPLISNLAAYGVTDLTTPCQNAPETCDASMRWDATGHPASGMHKAIALDLQATLVPVPAAAWMFASAILAVVGVRRRC